MMTTSRREAILRQNAVDALDNLARAAEDRSQGGLRGRFKGLVEDLAKEGTSKTVRAFAKRTLELGQKIRSTNARVDALDSTKVDTTAAATAVEEGEKALTRLGKGLLKVARNVALLTGDVEVLKRENVSLKDQLAATNRELAETRAMLANVSVTLSLIAGDHGQYASNIGAEQAQSHEVSLLDAIYIANERATINGTRFEDEFVLPDPKTINPTAAFAALGVIADRSPDANRSSYEKFVSSLRREDPSLDLSGILDNLVETVRVNYNCVNTKITGRLFEYVIDAMLESDQSVVARKLGSLSPSHLDYAKSVIKDQKNKAYVCGQIASVTGATGTDLEDTYVDLVQQSGGS